MANPRAVTQAGRGVSGSLSSHHEARWAAGVSMATGPEHSIRVVFADDNAMQRLLLRGLLEFAPHVDVAGEARDGREAVLLVERTASDLVLLDVEMPHLDGPTAAELILSSHPHTRILLHSSGASEDQTARAVTLGLVVLDKSRLLDTVGLIETLAAEAHPGDRAARAARPCRPRTRRCADPQRR